MTQVQVFDQDALKKRVSDTIAASFGLLIPEQQWQALVEKEVKAFFEEGMDWVISRQEGSWHSTSTATMSAKITPFRRIVWEKVNDLCQARVNELLNAEKFAAALDRVYGPTGNAEVDERLSAHLEAKLLEIAPKMAVAFFRSAFVGTVEQAKMEIRNEMQQKFGR